MKEIIYTVEIGNSDTCWKLNGNLHRTNGPAIENSIGIKFWYTNSDLNGFNGAIGTKFWYINNSLHRANGPAVEFRGGSLWYLNGKRYHPNSKAFKILFNSHCSHQMI